MTKFHAAALATIACLAAAPAIAAGDDLARLQVHYLEHRLSEAEGAALARATLAETAGSPASYRRSVARVEMLALEAHRRMAALRAAAGPDLVDRSCWTRLAAAANDPVVRELFRRAATSEREMALVSGLDGAEADAFAFAVAPMIDADHRADAAWLANARTRIRFDDPRTGPAARRAAALIVARGGTKPLEYAAITQAVDEP